MEVNAVLLPTGQGRGNPWLFYAGLIDPGDAVAEERHLPFAALCIGQGVSESLTGDRDFARFSGLRISNPFG